MRLYRPMKRPLFAMGSRRVPARRAFSLIELLIVMTLGAIIVTIALPRFDRMRMTVDAQDQAIRSLLMMAQRLAVTRGYDVVVAFDTAAGLVRVQEDANSNMLVDAGERVTWTKIEDGVKLGRGTSPVLRTGATQAATFTARQGTLPVVVFHRDGSTNEAGTLYLSTVRAQGSAYTTDGHALDVQRATGRVLPYKYSGSTWDREF